MIIELHGARRSAAAPIFAQMDDTTILSCLQDYPNSHVWVDNPEKPTCAHVLMGGRGEGTGGFSFVAGDAGAPAAKELVRMWPQEYLGGRIMVPQNEEWSAVIEAVFPKAVRETRYATSKSEHHFDADALRKMTADPAPELHVERITAGMYDTLYAEGWSRDLVANFPDGRTYERKAVGFACLHEGTIVGAASCYSVYDGGIEIEIDTREDFRRRGIARACASSIVLYALENGLYPSWDAANLMSVGLAKSLGYVFSHEYPAYWLGGER